jgi:hypothetical protein
MKKQQLSPEQAFKAMSVFLERYYERSGRRPELGILLGELQMAGDGMPFDRAAWGDWLAAIEEAKAAPQKGVGR